MMFPSRIHANISWPLYLSRTWLGAIWIESLWCLALVLPLGEAIWRSGAVRLQIIAMSLIIAIIWELLSAYFGRNRFSLYSIVTALTFAAIVPAAAPMWQLVLGLSFGIVIGAHIFGGYGWNFLNPVAVAIAFLIFSFPANNYSGIVLPSWEYCAPGLLLLIFAGVISWRIIVAAFFALAIGMIGIAGIGTLSVAVILSFIFPLTFLGSDPSAVPTMDPARWVYGLLIGLLAAAGLISGKPAAESFIAAILLGGIFAPLIDHVIVRIIFWRGETGHG